MPYDNSIREEELKNKVAQDYFSDYDTTQIVGNIDFCVAVPGKDMSLFELESLLWAEAKKGNKSDIYASFVQLIMTIGKAHTFDQKLPPAFLGAFDAEKIAFLPYHKIIDVFYQNDFNWNVAPNDHTTKEFLQLYETVKTILDNEMLIFRFGTDDKELHGFIRRNFIVGKSHLSKIRINKNNFTHIYRKWRIEVLPTIAGVDWQKAKKQGIIDADFYLADILSEHNMTLRERLFVLLRSDHYELDREVDDSGFFSRKEAGFSDNQKAHTQFWNRYNRPPKREYWDDIIKRRDFLVPQDVRERKGSFFTPQQWVEKSQEYIAQVLGEDWQDEYFVWDCAAGTGNLLAGLTNKYNIYASTLDQADVDVMHTRIKMMNENSPDGNGSNLLDSHVFQFDFLNDDFAKLPQSLQDIINDPDKRRKLVIYINPPYAEADNRKGEGRSGVAENKIHNKYADVLKKAQRELTSLFLIRIKKEIPNCFVGEFSTLKILQAGNFIDFRKVYTGQLCKSFIVPGDTFDNVKGQFPIGFFIWDLKEDKIYKTSITDVFDKSGNNLGTKELDSYDSSIFINKWIDIYRPDKKVKDSIGTMIGVANDFQNQRLNRIGQPYMKVPADNHNWQIVSCNLVQSCIYFAVRHCIEATWLNDRDQFLYPCDGWQTDMEFQTDCLAFTLFHGQNRITATQGTNRWIPFTEEEVGAKERFESHFMIDFITRLLSGEIRTDTIHEYDLFSGSNSNDGKMPSLQQQSQFSAEARAVFDAGRQLWQYYHAQPDANPNASFYDIRGYFQGFKIDKRNKPVMNADSTDETYTELIKTLRERLKTLALKIEPKVYKYGFLK